MIGGGDNQKEKKKKKRTQCAQRNRERELVGGGKDDRKELSSFSDRAGGIPGRREEASGKAVEADVRKAVGR
jgi:hypothetical protein